MLSNLPTIGVVFGFVGKLVCDALSAPPDLVIGALKQGCNWLLGGCAP